MTPTTGELGILEDVALELVGAGGQLGGVLQPVGEGRQPLLEVRAQLVVGIGVDTLEKITDPVEEAVEDVVVDGTGEPPGDLLVEEALHVVVAQRIGEADGDVGTVLGHPAGVGGIREPRGRAFDRARRTDPIGDYVGRQEVLLYELAQGAAELVLALDDDGGVGDGQPEWTTEQGGDREPVGQASHHRTLRQGLDVAGPAAWVTSRAVPPRARRIRRK